MFTTCTHNLQMNMTMTTRSLKDIYTYEKQALDLIPIDHPHKEELESLLIEQVNDELKDHANTRAN